MDNLLQDLPKQLTQELVTVLVQHPNVRVERIVSTGQCSPEDFWYDQTEEEWVMVLKGAGIILFEDGIRVVMKPGDQLLIPAHRRHRVEWTTPAEPTVWLAVFLHN